MVMSGITGYIFLAYYSCIVRNYCFESNLIQTSLFNPAGQVSFAAAQVQFGSHGSLQHQQ